MLIPRVQVLSTTLFAPWDFSRSYGFVCFQPCVAGQYFNLITHLRIIFRDILNCGITERKFLDCEFGPAISELR